jgi:hypothetical protein
MGAQITMRVRRRREARKEERKKESIRGREEGIDVPWRCMTVRNLTMTLEDGRIRTWRLPAFSALLIALRQSLRTEVLTMLAVAEDSQWREGD